MKQVIAVSGSPHSGKTTISLALAASLAAKKYDVVVISGDVTAPMLKVYAPLSDVSQSLSVGGLLMDSDLTEKAVTERIVLHPKSERLGFMGMATGDNITTYPQRFDDERIQTMFVLLYRNVDYLIIDCTSNPMTDGITRKGLEEAHTVLRLSTPDMVGLEYWRGMVTIMRDERFSHSRAVPCICPARPVSPVREVREMHKAVLGDIRYIFPYSHEVENRAMAGRLIKWLGRKDGIVFEDTLERLVKSEILKPKQQQKEDSAHG